MKLFNNEKVVFSELDFNRMLVYKNKYQTNNEHFLKQAVFYITGKADISFQPNSLDYNYTTQTLTLFHSKNRRFDIDVDYNISLIDQINPKPLSSEEAIKISAVVGLVAAVGGGMIGHKIHSTVGSFLPKNTTSDIITTGAVGIATGSTVFFMSNSMLDQLQIMEELTQSELFEVEKQAIAMIKSLLLNEPELFAVYQDKFETYIKSIYAMRNMNIDTIIYKELN